MIFNIPNFTVLENWTLKHAHVLQIGAKNRNFSVELNLNLI